ncbi:tRNA1(Val) (adenine(37)-N6)-methyltransferase [Flavobacterium cellulosilyticum]|uniref:tRNA1(Val) (adenine(37)-N6)-methyltransferase n=1 Tax=Flavobacterium cellulosilyticum TaxID=2541731 RepID=A0A4R5C7M2_9FLAO|nr:methyltransferase [Flavobacterium cellulosilyticum]TDD94566.1 methyltransferase domain-containing protein [Flavobacterium cellulosilyticum]
MSKFQFKQFSVEQDRCAMKIGTDGVLLGAWAPIENNPFSILDIGTGTGIIALMLSQRSAATQIDAVEIDEEAYEQATDNFENSPWNDRLFCFHAGIDEFIEEPEDEYDLIVSNPPFYSEDYKSNDEQRDLARFQSAMPFEDLIEVADLLLSENGLFAVIIPFKEEQNFIALAKEFELFPVKITRVKGTPTTEVKRSLLAFKRYDPSDSDRAEQLSTFTADELTIETARHIYTPEYIELTKDFYLKM